MSEPPSHWLKQAKRRLRRSVLAERDAHPPDERASLSASIVQRFLELPEAAAAETVMAFWSFGSEVDTAGLIERLHGAGKMVALPRIEGRDLAAVSYAPGDPVTPTSFGAMEPASGQTVDPAEFELVVVPGLAFDRQGRRVGYGGGFYDRFLRGLGPAATTVAIAFDLQLVGEVPEGGVDRRVDIVVTEHEVIRCR